MGKFEAALERFSKKYKEALATLLDGKMLPDLSWADAKEVKKMAREEAFAIEPGLKLSLEHYQWWLQRKRWHGGSSDMTPDQQCGAKVLNKMGQICLRKFHPPRTKKKKTVLVSSYPPTINEATLPTTLTQKYLAWIKDHDTVPTDDVLSFFMGCVNTNWSNARAEARELGYKFDRVDGGMWQVTSRPLPEVQELEDNEKDRLLRKVLSMPDLNDAEVVKILRKII